MMGPDLRILNESRSQVDASWNPSHRYLDDESESRESTCRIQITGIQMINPDHSLERQMMISDHRTFADKSRWALGDESRSWEGE